MVSLPLTATHIWKHLPPNFLQGLQQRHTKDTPASSRSVELRGPEVHPSAVPAERPIKACKRGCEAHRDTPICSPCCQHAIAQIPPARIWKEMCISSAWNHAMGLDDGWCVLSWCNKKVQQKPTG
eukprot:scaffold19115_cov19-Tisochrysis_lutea.AAC.2